MPYTIKYFKSSLEMRFKAEIILYTLADVKHTYATYDLKHARL